MFVTMARDRLAVIPLDGHSPAIRPHCEEITAAAQRHRPQADALNSSFRHGKQQWHRKEKNYAAHQIPFH